MIIIKIGGGKEINVEGIIKDLSEIIKGKNEKVIIVHGANYFRDSILKDLGKQKKVITSVSGYESVFSDKDAIDVMMMAYAGLRNKRIVELCQQHGINAVGLSGLDGKAIVGKRNIGIRARQGEKIKIFRDFSGKPRRVNKDLLGLLLDKEYVPVLCVPIIDENNSAINSENDDIVNLLQKEFGADKIISLIEAPGFLGDKDDEKTLVKEINRNELIKKEQKVSGRMKRKILSLRKLFDDNQDIEVYISDGRVKNPIKDALNNKGTIIR